MSARRPIMAVDSSETAGGERRARARGVAAARRRGSGGVGVGQAIQAHARQGGLRSTGLRVAGTFAPQVTRHS